MARSRGMWPSEATANIIANWANIFLIASLVLGVLSTGLVVWMSNIKEAYWDEDRQAASERIAETNERAALLEKSNIELRAKLAGRRITAEQHRIIVDVLSRSPGVFDLATMRDPETILYAKDILRTLADAKWTTGQPELPLGEIWTGLILFQTDDPNLGKIVEALRKAGIPFSFGDDQHKRSKATIMVGNKVPEF